jgi:hypothetical protein
LRSAAPIAGICSSPVRHRLGYRCRNPVRRC